MKSEPETYGIDHLIAERDSTGMWEGCRNYTVRNYIRDEMSIGDLSFFYHSNADPSGIVGTMEVVSEAYPDPTQWEPESKYYDPKSPKENPRWWVRDVRYLDKFPRTISLAELRETPGLEDMIVTRKGLRLSITPVTPEEWEIVLRLAGA
jgi:predicted RNA-binding protein with PUA-like domain